MSLNFPLIDLRKNPDGSWNQNHVTDEPITVPTSSPYIIRLIEVPDNGDVNDRPKISGLTETLIYPPIDNTFYVDYRTGDLVFHQNQAGNSYLVDYWQCGSLIEVAEINYLYDRSLYVSDSPPLNPIQGKQWFNTLNNITYNFNPVLNKWISITTFSYVFGNEGKTRNQYLNYYVGRSPSIRSGLRLNRDALILSLSGQFASLNTGTFQIRKNNLQTNLISLDIVNDLGKHTNNLNLDLEESDTIQCFFESNNDVTNPIIVVELAWRV